MGAKRPLSISIYTLLVFVRVFVCNKRQFCLFLFYNVYKEKMFTIKKEVGRKAPCKPSFVN